VAGYVAYDTAHWALHSGAWDPFVTPALRTSHMDHHYKNDKARAVCVLGVLRVLCVCVGVCSRVCVLRTCACVCLAFMFVLFVCALRVSVHGLVHMCVCVCACVCLVCPTPERKDAPKRAAARRPIYAPPNLNPALPAPPAPRHVPPRWATASAPSCTTLCSARSAPRARRRREQSQWQQGGLSPQGRKAA
jgi:hypothetical protein